MSVPKRKWTSRTGEQKEAWIVDYVDQEGSRHIETFKKKKAADAFAQQVGVDIRAGTHMPASRSITVDEAAADWVRTVELAGRERSTVGQYHQRVKHIVAGLGGQKLTNLTTPRINAFRDDLSKCRSRALARKVLTSLKSMLKDAKRRGDVAYTVQY
jgi:integrase